MLPSWSERKMRLINPNISELCSVGTQDNAYFGYNLNEFTSSRNKNKEKLIYKLKFSFPVDNGYSIAYFNKPFVFIVNIIVYYTYTHKIWALPMFA